MKFKLLLLSFLLFVTFSWGQTSIATLGTPVVENFTSYLGTSSLPANWTTSGSGTNGNTFSGSNQSGGTSGGWYGNNNMSYLGSSNATNGNATWKLKNNTGSTITSFDISFVAKMWKSAANSPTVSLTYSTNSTGIVPGSGALTSILTFNDATANVATGTTLSQTVSSLSVPNGDYIYIRFIHSGNSSSDNLGWDDVSITCNGGCASAAITTQPSTTVQNLCQGATATSYSVAATGTTVSYQWYSNTSATNSGGIAVGTNSASYTPSVATVGTLYYYCEVTAACGATVASNVSGAVNVMAVPGTPAGTISISANPSCGAATLTYSAPSANLYWQTATGGTSTANPTTSSFTSLATAGTYTRYVRELNGTCWSPEIAITFTVVAPISISAQPPNRTITDGNNTTFTVTASGSSPTYQWQVDTGSGFVNLTNVAPYSTVTTATLSITAAPLSMNGYLYRCVVSGATPCGSVTSNAGSLTVSLTAPNNPTTLVPCYGNNTLGLSWTASSGGSAPDGYMVFALAGGTSPAATSAVAGNSSLYTVNSDFSLAGTVTASLGKCVYKGTGTSVTITGLTNLSSYSFKVVAYRGTTGTAWSSGINTSGTWNTPATNIAIDMPEVTSLTASIASGQSVLAWTRPTPSACYDQYLVVANQGSVVFTPTGDGTSYIPNTVYSGPNQVVYNGTGAGFTVTGLTNGLSYCYKVYVRRGTEWSDGVQVCQTPNLVYCASGATSSGDSEIEKVTLVGSTTTISNNTTNVCTTGVNNYTAMSADVQVGGAYTVTVEFGDCDGGTQYDGAGGVWIDWNNDGDFADANETIGTALVAVSGGNVTQNFALNVPVGQALGNYRMRIVQTESATLATLNPCGTFSFGSTEDYTVQVINACVPTHSVTSFTPTSGPVGTEVTINGTGLTGVVVSFSGVNATILSNTGTQIVAVIPTSATSGMLTVKDSQPCSINNSYTVLKDDKSACEGYVSNLIIYEIFDEERASGGTITILNGTSTTKNLSDYRIYRASTYGGAYSNFATLTGSLAPGALGIIKVTGSDCGPAATNGSISGGFNDSDGMQLRLADGTTVVDDVQVPNYIGYYMKRNAGAMAPRTVFVGADWTTVDVGEVPAGTNECLPMGTAPTAVNSPIVTAQPTYTPSCGSSAAILTTAGTEGVAGGINLAYQWYFAVPGSAAWTLVTDGGIYSDATTASLHISSTSGVLNYQYYCQIRENLATCYTATNAVKIVAGTTTTWNGTTWSNSAPTLGTQAVINGNYNTAVNGDFECCSLTINSSYTLDIKDGDFVTIQNDLTVNGTLEVQNQGSLVMISDSGMVTNNGTTNIRKMSTPFDRYDYTFWSSPIVNAAISVYNQWQTNNIFKLNTAAFRDDNNDSHDDNNNAWVFTPQAELMSPGRGYAAMGKINQTYPAQQGSVYSGRVNNGVVTQPIALSLDNAKDNDDFNLIGNPYPSAISADAFITTNTDISGTLYFWTHEGNIQVAAINPGPMAYNFSPDDFAYYNLTGGTGTRPGVLSGNGNSNVPTGFIASGQGFQVDADAATAVTFNNSMRSKTHDNSNFYRTASAPVEKDRIWLNLTNSEGIFNQQLIGFFPQATMGVDRGYDGFYLKSNTYAAFYSMIADKAYKIQGRSVFDVNDRVPLGFRSGFEKTYSISIGDIEGVLRTQNVYIEDLQLNIIHDLKASAYVFSTPAGEFNSRFVLRFTNSTLGNDDFETNANSVVVFAGEGITVTSSSERIKDVFVYDVLGRLIAEKKGADTTSVSLMNFGKTKEALLVKVVLINGQTTTKKILY